MLKQESNEIDRGENNRARTCDACQLTACTVYCHADSAYLCKSCDAQVHSANRVASRHKRVLICESCENAPAAFLCEADDASLCTACDSEVHSANPLARRHQRVPVLPISGNSYSSMATHHQNMTLTTNPENKLAVAQEEGAEDAKVVASWLFFPNSDKKSGNHNNNNQNNGLFFSDGYLDLVDYNPNMDYKFTGEYNQHQQDCSLAQTSYGGDGVVPLQLEDTRGQISSMETGVVPEPTARVTTASHPRTPKGKIDQIPDPSSEMITQLSPMDREARVLRYKEKKKTRKFEKTIRYASRKAYAERRPRINGRFAKRGETEEAEHEGYNPMLMSDIGYGIVPSF